jgi:Tfp pilus assembly protein PilX
MRVRQNLKGFALTMVIIILVLLALLATYITSISYNQRRFLDRNSSKRMKIFYCAKAGVVDANWRIRTNYTAGLLPAAGSFANDVYDPAPYNLDVDGDGTVDTTVDIGPVTNAATKERAINSTGLDL